MVIEASKETKVRKGPSQMLKEMHRASGSPSKTAKKLSSKHRSLQREGSPFEQNSPMKI